MVKSGTYTGMIVSLVCRIINFDGAATLSVECADGGKLDMRVEGPYEFAAGKVVEIMGCVEEDGGFQVCYIFVPCNPNHMLHAYSSKHSLLNT
jgi:hypothetical protein